MNSPEPGEPSSPSRWARILASPRAAMRAALALIAIACLIYLALAIPRLTNNLLSDSEFTGWSSPLAERLARGERPYVDFVLPIPPGSFVLLAALHAIAGRALLVQELWLAGSCQLAMGAIAYVLAAKLTTRINALMVSAATLVTLVIMPKEIVYDHTGQLCAWISLAIGVSALFARDGSRRWRLWLASGITAAATGIFKQSTATGIVAGWLAALAYLAIVELASGDRAAARARLRELLVWLIGAGIGTATLVLTLLSLGSELGAYWQAVFVDGPELKGGSSRLLQNLLNYLMRFDSYPASLALSAVAAFVIVRIARSDGGFDPSNGGAEAPARSVLAVVAIAIVAFGAASASFALGIEPLWPPFHFWADRMRLVPGFGLLFMTVFVMAWLAKTRAADPSAPPAGSRRGHALIAIVIVALSVSLLHNLSFPGFRPFYDNNPIIPIAFTFLFLAFDRARLPRLKLALFALALTPLFGVKFERALEARINVGNRGHWAGMQVNERGHEVIRAALRVRALAGPDDEVLVLPEDLQLMWLIDRPRPPIRGAVVFVDQYPERLVAEDLATLERDLPKVVVIHPSDRRLWRQMFEIWMYEGGAYHIMERFLDDLLPKHYRLDSSFDTRFARQRAKLQVWVRKDAPR